MPPKKKTGVVLPTNNVLKDVSKRVWKIGERIGSGGFGEVFLCQEDSGKAVGKNANFVIKIEPSGSGPLFCEMHFYMRAATKDSIDEWVSKRKLDYLGMPVLHSKGQYDVNGSVYRYIIIDRYSNDLESLQQKDGKLPVKTALTVGVRMLDVLEYVHSNGYIHADLKASNIMLGLKEKSRVFLCDFGLACKFTRDDGHKEQKENKKKMHNGTIEYTSRDAHKGMESRRADIEILAYNLLHWLSGKLPWLDSIKNCDSVAASKEKNMKNIKELIGFCFGKSGNSTVESFFKLLAKLDFQDEPDYEAFRNVLKTGLKTAGVKYDGKIELETTKKKSQKRVSEISSASEEENETDGAASGDPPVKKKARKPVTRKAKATVKKATPKDDEKEHQSSSSQENLTPAMKLVLEMKERKDAEKSLKKKTKSKK